MTSSPSSTVLPVSENTDAWNTTVDKLKAFKSFTLHTGNLNNYVELKKKRHKTSADELTACLDMQLSNVSKNLTIRDDGIVLLSGADAPLSYDRDDLKITLKVFMNVFDYHQIHEAITATTAQLNVQNIEQLIIDFPHPGDGEVDNVWVEKALSVWRDAEHLVATGKVVSIGVADFNLDTLKAFYEAVNVKPCVNHFNLDACCMVPPDLQAYAQENDIQLLTHNDPHPFPLRDVFQTICTLRSDARQLVCQPVFVPAWAARYTVWIRRRSIMAAKGYVVDFHTAQPSDNGVNGTAV